MSTYIEVCFRGENETCLLPWRPTEGSTFECSAIEAQERFDDLMEAGEEGRAIDGVVPYVVEIRKVKRTFVPYQNADAVTIDSLLLSYAEPDAIQWGPWATKTAQASMPEAA